MRLTRYTDYSLRVLMYLAVQPDRVATIEEISAAYDVSRGHLMKVVHELGRAGFVETLRGRGGGLRLARDTRKITVGEVVRSTEESLDLVECFGAAESGCCIEVACALHGVLDQALHAFLEVLDACSLEDLVARRRQPLLRLLSPA